jgi:hypothetical protein
LLYSGANTKIYAHYMPWFGQASHENIGYSTNDPTQSAKTVSDMVSRGIQGVIIDWYGPDASFEDSSTLSMFNAAQQYPGFQFGLMVDASGIKGNPTSSVINALGYAWQKYMQAGNYMRINGRPVVFYFGVDTLGIDWNYIRANAPGNPMFIFENSGSFGLSYSDGAFSWVGDFVNPADWDQPYFDNFYGTGNASGKQTVGSVIKGFNDRGAAWSGNRVVNQNCGQTWLHTFSEIGRYYSSGHQLQNLQLVTWNDYEEGTAIEPGIENCVTISGSASGSALSWSIQGNENTVNHYTVFISSDGENLMPVADIPSGVHQLDLVQFGFDKGAYTVYVEAVGQPSMKNHMSGPIGFTSAGGGSSSSASSQAPAGADMSVSATPSTINVAQGGSAYVRVTITPKGNFNAPVALGCGNLAAGLSCSFDRSSVTPGTNTVSATMTIKANSATVASNLFGVGGQFAFWFPGLGIGMVVLGDKQRRRRMAVALGALAIVALMTITVGCGGGGKGSASPLNFGSSNSTAPSARGTYQVTIVAQSGSVQRTTTATVAVQ